ncbi:MAG: hypothetical protein K9L28_10140 [Synergistales bacterium]|nr:hypothetical protein [Synergistales bacterium]
MKRLLLVGLAVLVVASGVVLFSRAYAAEDLYVCRPCSRAFIPVAQDVVTELGLEDEVNVIPSSCLGGPCNVDAVVGFRGEVYAGMDEEKLRMFLQYSFQ